MAAFSGKEGSVAVGASNDMAELLEWTLEYGSNIHEYFSRAGSGAGQTVDGAHSGSGTLRLNFDPTNPVAALLPTGSLATLTLNLASGGACTGSARIGKHSYGAKISGEPLEVTIPFTTHGAWTLPTT